MTWQNLAAIARWAGISRTTLWRWRTSRPVIYHAIIEKYQREKQS